MSTFVNNNVASGDIVRASDHNTQGANVATVLNGGIDNDNINSSAGIAGSKLADDSVTAAKLDFGGSGTGVWWEELGRHTLGATADTLSVSSLTNKKHYKIIVCGITSASTNLRLRFNGDTGTNYATRFESNGATDSTSLSNTSITASQTGTFNHYLEATILNIQAQEKLVIYESINGGASGAGTAPGRLNGVGKWANTADVISRIDIVNVSTGDFAAGSELIILGHD